MEYVAPLDFNTNAGVFFLFLNVSKNVYIVPDIFLRSSPKDPCNQCPTVKYANDSGI